MAACLQGCSSRANGSKRCEPGLKGSIWARRVHLHDGGSPLPAAAATVLPVLGRTCEAVVVQLHHRHGDHACNEGQPTMDTDRKAAVGH